MSDDYDFAVRWYDNEISLARKEANKVEGQLAALKNTTSRYYLAHLTVLRMRQAALAAMEAIPRPEALVQP